jgi:hypothetical protein
MKSMVYGRMPPAALDDRTRLPWRFCERRVALDGRAAASI